MLPVSFCWLVDTLLMTTWAAGNLVKLALLDGPISEFPALKVLSKLTLANDSVLVGGLYDIGVVV